MDIVFNDIYFYRKKTVDSDEDDIFMSKNNSTAQSSQNSGKALFIQTY